MSWNPFHLWKLNLPDGGDSGVSGNYFKNIESTINDYFKNISGWSNRSIQEKWDRIGGSSAQYGKYARFTGGDTWTKTMPSEVLNVYEDLSTSIFKSPLPVNAGYAYDEGYYKAYGAHSGIDINNSNIAVRSPINGVVAVPAYREVINGQYNGWVTAIDETDANGKKVGRRWWFVHLKPPGQHYLQPGTKVYAGQTVLSSGNELGHLHLTVQDVSGGIGNGYGSYNQAVADLRARTMSPLHAYWKYRNGISEAKIWNA